ncbi:MAG: DUF5107 domain-containing protein, partial [Bacteroidaceae bacterium]|nr:DUF5107 domain-containing protein [Bacteroidaceae bacterium]
MVACRGRKGQHLDCHSGRRIAEIRRVVKFFHNIQLGKLRNPFRLSVVGCGRWQRQYSSWRAYQAVWLENEYIKVMILPELGGRVQMAYDKIAQRHFIYYNQVIKPALVGLAGP